MKVYLVFEEVDKEGEFGDAISTIEPVSVFRDETDAVNYVNKRGLDYQELELY